MEFENTTLGQLSIGGKGSYGIAASAVPYSENLLTYLRITDISDQGTLKKQSFMSVADKNADNYLLKPNDIVFARTGNSTGRNYFYDGTDGNFVYAGFLIKFSLDPKKVNPRYIKYYCQSTQYWNWVQSFNTGSTRGNINAQTFANMEIPLPPREQQDFLVRLLKPLDDKIELNQKINENLERQAQAIFSERFSDFSANNLPNDWKAVHLGDVAIISNKSFNPSKEPETLLEHYSIPAFDEARFPVFELSTRIKSNKFIVDKDCFMISKLNPTTKRVWRPYCISDKAVCSTEFIVYKAREKRYTDFLYALIDSERFSDFICSHVTGSTGSRQRTAPSDTLQFEFAFPPAEEISAFTAIVQPMYQQIKVNAIENDKLKRIRDTLLPKLMAGEIDVSSIQC